MRRAFTLSLLCLLACGDDAPPSGSDASTDECTRDEECSDGVFCNGLERCVEGTCEVGATPCPTPLLCDEAANACRSPGCDVSADADGDGHDAIACGGDDCDDTDPNRFPGNVERCDLVDQDCDPSTFGDTDADGDGFVSATCCDGARCGTDCDDLAAGVNPTSPETCNGIDDDCDGSIDEGVLRRFFPDLDRDGFGDRDGVPVLACFRADDVAENALDCDDESAAVAPTATERCNGVDDNCNGVIDDPDATAIACTASFGSPPRTFFSCEAGACVIDRCVTGFADCNGEPSDGCETDLTRDIANCGACGTFCGVGGACDAGTCDRVVDVTAGAEHTCALRSPSGKVVCWGGNTFSQLGDFSTTSRARPVVVGPVSDALDVETHPFETDAFACYYTCARTESLVYCWGCGRYGQMGDGDPEERNLMPEPVNGVPAGTTAPLLPDLSIGGGHACARADEEGVATTWCWGHDDLGQVSSDCAETFCEATPARLVDGRTIDRAFAGYRHTCFLAGTAALCVGNNDEGQLGDGSRVDRAAPVAVQGGHAFVSLAAGAHATCGVRSDGRVLCWGDNAAGQLGDGTTTRRLAPTLVTGVTGAVAVVLSESFACALLDDESVRCWGEGVRGQLGDGRMLSSPTAVVVDAPPLTAITSGAAHACGVDRAGDVWCWGANTRRQIGDAPLGDLVPTPVRLEAL